jgi:hypothetical protein
MRRSRFIVCLGLAVLADAFAASAELNPVRTHPTIQGEPAVQGVIVKLRVLLSQAVTRRLVLPRIQRRLRSAQASSSGSRIKLRPACT